ncbi:MAG: EAL domain-containing protein [Treponemataceae bacterium]|nr:EAL domain-containing protein [Treponemataceae bacterium]
MSVKQDRKSVLIIDNDDEVSQQLVETFCDDYEIILVNNVISALEFLELDRCIRKIYLVILSLDLLEDSSFTLLESMKIDPVYSEIPVIAITNSVDSETEMLALKNGAMDCMFQPLNYQLLFQQGENYIKRNEENFYKINKVISDQTKYMNSELEHRANIDELTGIYNRFSFCEKTEKLLKTNINKTYLIYRFNIEKFYVINDLFGGKVGDEILKAIANTLREVLPEGAIYGRLESDHFVACVESHTCQGADILDEIEKAAKKEAPNADIQVKMGMYPIVDTTLPVISMCDRANMALQSIKGNYLKKSAFYDKSLNEILHEEQKLVKDMKAALEKKEFEIYLQPIVSLIEEKVVSAEALVRWNHPKRGLMAPSGFVPFFEKSGLIATLDYYVWDLAFAYQKKRCDQGLPEMPISVNISRMSLYNPKLCEDIINLSRRYEVKPQLIKLEVTESAYNDNPTQMMNTMSELQRYGFLILMDDFGSGYSSLNMLKTIPVDILKIDMCFLQDFGKVSKAASILTSVVRMAKWLNIPVVCEGVENKDQLEFLKEIGSDFVQGYYFSKPIPISEFEEFEKADLSDRDILNPIIQDISEVSTIFDSNELASRIFNTFIGAFGFYEFSNNHLEVLRVNDNYYSMMGYTPETFHSNKMNVFEMIVPEDREIILTACKSAVQGNMPAEIMVRRYLPDGTVIWLSIIVRFFGGDEKRAIICCAMNNITEQKASESRAEERSIALVKYLERVRSILDAVPYGICQYEIDGSHSPIFANRACYEMYGTNHQSDYIAENIHSDCNIFSLKKTEEFMKILQKVKETGEDGLYSAEIIREDGSILPIRGRVSIVDYYDGRKVFQDTFYDAEKEGSS